MAKVTDRFGRPHDTTISFMVYALVTDNVDPEQLGRIKVKYPYLPNTPESYWVRIMTPMAGRERGWMMLPEIGDEVLVSFEHGNFEHAIVVGSLYNGKDKPPYANEDGENNLRVFQSRSGHRLTFDDTKDEERVELVLGNEEISIICDDVEGKLSIYCGGDIEVTTKDRLSIISQDFVVKADEIDITAGSNIVMTGGQETSVEGAAQINLKAPNVTVN